MARELRRELEGEMRAVVIAGRLEDGELSAHYASADIFLFSSATETFGNVTMEAMASGLAVVAYDYAAARQHIVHGHSGMLTPVNDRNGFVDHAAALAGDLPRARALGLRARAVAEPLRWEKIVAEFEGVLLETLSLHSMATGNRHAAA
jgi:glycosyltransferase involved in cell wall biosynthesis